MFYFHEVTRLFLFLRNLALTQNFWENKSIRNNFHIKQRFSQKFAKLACHQQICNKWSLCFTCFLTRSQHLLIVVIFKNIFWSNFPRIFSRKCLSENFRSNPRCEYYSLRISVELLFEACLNQPKLRMGSTKTSFPSVFRN